MKIREKLESWARRSGVLSAFARVILSLIVSGSIAVGWILIFYISTLVAFSVLPSKELPEKMFTLVFLLAGLLALPTLYAVYWLTQRLEQRPFASVGLQLSSYSLREFLSGLTLGGILASIGLLFIYRSGIVQVTWNPAPLTPELLGSVLLIILGWFGVAFWEELYFRGYLLQTLASGIGIVPAVLASSILFGAIHIGTYGMKPLILLNLVFLGIVLVALYLKTKSLWAPIGMHFANNFFIAHVLSIPIDIKFPLIKIDGQPLQLEPLRLLIQTEFAEGKSFADLYTWSSVPFNLVFIGVLVFLIWKLPLFRAHPEMEALWQQYVPIAQPWVQLKSWWAKRKGQREVS